MSGEKTAPEAAPESDYPEIMTIDQAARYLQLHKQVVYRHVRKGTIGLEVQLQTMFFNLLELEHHQPWPG